MKNFTEDIKKPMVDNVFDDTAPNEQVYIPAIVPKQKQKSDRRIQLTMTPLEYEQFKSVCPAAMSVNAAIRAVMHQYYEAHKND